MKLLLPPANVVCEGCVFTGVCLSTGGVGIPACLAGHMTRQQYISRCTVDVSQLVWRQHTGNIKCMMGYVTWYTPPDREPPRRRPPQMENPSRWRTPQEENPPGGEPPQEENPPDGEPDGEPPQEENPTRWRPPDPENVHFNCNNTFLTCFFKYLHRLMSINVLLT